MATTAVAVALETMAAAEMVVALDPAARYGVAAAAVTTMVVDRKVAVTMTIAMKMTIEMIDWMTIETMTTIEMTTIEMIETTIVTIEMTIVTTETTAAVPESWLWRP